MREWIDVIRQKEFFDLLILNQQNTLNRKLSHTMETTHGPISIQHDEVHSVKVVPKDFPGIPPNFIGVSGDPSYRIEDGRTGALIPHAYEPAPAMRFGCISFVWGEIYTGSKDAAQDVIPYRDDNLPAVISATGLSIHYQHGKLHRKGNNPAIKAEHIGASWFGRRDRLFRGNGPAHISFESYNEFWTEGKFRGHKWIGPHLTWSIPQRLGEADDFVGFLNTLSGNTRALGSEVYFENEQDEVVFMADFA